jgi:hypothetical protein
LEGNLSFKECGESLKLMKNGKRPGSDGFTVDFYKFIWKDIGQFGASSDSCFLFADFVDFSTH